MKIKVLFYRIFRFPASKVLPLLFCLFSLPALTAQTGSSGQTPDPAAPAILARGPLEQRGLPLGYANSVPCRYGLYRWGDEEIRVYHTDVEMDLMEQWTEFRCGRTVLLQRAVNEGRAVYFRSPRGWGVFIVHGDGLSVDACTFITAFSERLTYFLSISELFSFPAVLEIAREG